MISDYLADEFLDWLKGNAVTTPPTALYLSLHSANPGPDGLSNDVSTLLAGGRATLTLANLGALADDAEGGRVVSSQSEITFTTSAASSGTITYVGVWDAVSGGNFLLADPTSQPYTVLPGDIIRIPAGQLQLKAIGLLDAV